MDLQSLSIHIVSSVLSLSDASCSLSVMLVVGDYGGDHGGGGGGWITSLTRSWLQKCEVATTHVRSYILSCYSLALLSRRRQG